MIEFFFSFFLLFAGPQYGGIHRAPLIRSRVTYCSHTHFDKRKTLSLRHANASATAFRCRLLQQGTDTLLSILHPPPLHSNWYKSSSSSASSSFFFRGGGWNPSLVFQWSCVRACSIVIALHSKPPPPPAPLPADCWINKKRSRAQRITSS